MNPIRKTFEDFEKALEISVSGHRSEAPLAGVSTDSRTIQPGDIFFAIRGPKFDGHDHVAEAARKGAGGFVVEKPWMEASQTVPDFNVLCVEDTTQALGKSARYFRRKSSAKRIAVTGSAGKTSTKEIAASVLRKKYRVRMSPGNWNNQFGLPYTLFQIQGDEEILVVELGASKPGDIQHLSWILSRAQS